MCVCETYEPQVELAIHVFKAQDRASIYYLKNFLTVLPTPKYIEQVLLAAIYRLADIDPNACRWILGNHRYLEPELDLIEVAKKFVLKKLETQGLQVQQDFRFDTCGHLQLNERALTCLMSATSAYERLLLEEVLQVRIKDEG
ncbi:hypothetical protein NUACC21_71630 [Scytonema sp. NUACC21]